MDSIVSAALEEVCARAAVGIPLPELWPSLRSSLSAAGLRPSESVKRAIWARLLALPGLRFEVGGAQVCAEGPPVQSVCKDERVELSREDPSIQSVDEAERLDLVIVAEEHIRDNFLGIYDLNASVSSEVSQDQRRTLERIAAARTNGITQNELAKELGIKANNFFYIVRNLEFQHLIIRQSTIIRAKESGIEDENGLKSTSIVNTNLLRIYRFAKNLNSNSQQKIEITRPDILESFGSADANSVNEDGVSGDCVKDDVSIKDYLPAMRAVCDKLEEANGKVLVVSDIKKDLGYRNTAGHRAWRNIMNRLKDAHLVEEIQAKVNKKVVCCLRLLKKFDCKSFQPKTNLYGSESFDSEHLLRHGKRGQITDQLVELPIEHRIYDMVDAEGSKGITIAEVYKRLGLNSKKIYSRINAMRKRFRMPWQAEIHDRTSVYRVWTFENYPYHSNSMVRGNSGALSKNEFTIDPMDLTPHAESLPKVQLKDSDFTGELIVWEKTDSRLVGKELPVCGLAGNAQTVWHGTEHQNHAWDFPVMGDDLEPGSNLIAPEANALPSEKCLSVSSQLKAVRRYPCLSSTLAGTRREQRIVRRLKKEKFILTVELYRWLEGLDKDKRTRMDRKTLTRTLNKLQQEGLCKCIQVSIPVVTNYSRSRITEVILHPSVDNLSSELLEHIYRRQRDLDIQIRGRGSAKSTNDRPLTVLTDVRSSNHVDDKPAMLEAMCANGFVPAKMVRAKLLHKFLWGYLSNSLGWHGALNNNSSGDDLNNPLSTCQLFALAEAIKTMQLELFLQVVGSPKEIDNMIEKCKLGFRLSDLPVEEYKRLMDTHATGRLSVLINILLRLKLIQLARKGLVEDVNVLPHAVLTHAMELKPYIEEPPPKTLPSSNVKHDLRPRIRHDFILSKQDAVDAYWQTLEYCYVTADPAGASHAFPGSSVPEVFHARSWASVRVMTAEQRMELLKCLANAGPDKKMPFKESVKIARELNLTLEQVCPESAEMLKSIVTVLYGFSCSSSPCKVLRFYYDKRQSRLHRHSGSKSKEQASHIDAENCGSFSKKRKRSSNSGLLKHSQDNNKITESTRAITSITCVTAEQNTGQTFGTIAASVKHDCDLPACGDNCDVNATANSEMHEEDSGNLAILRQCAFHRRKPMRAKRFLWTDNLDRQLVMQYARHRAALGARFYRVDWASMSDLPALPSTCGRRMAVLNSNINVRRAVMGLCNLLGGRYATYLDTKRTQEKRSSTQNSELNFQLQLWDDVEDPDVKIALDEVLRYKTIAKTERVGSENLKEWPIIPLTDGSNSDVQESVTSQGTNVTSRKARDITQNQIERCENSSIISTSRSRSKQSHGKFLELLNNRGVNIRRKVCKSLTIANAVELLKLVFASTSVAPEVQTSLAATLQLYSEGDIFAAFNYLKEKNFMVTGHGSRPFVLSRKFWRNASSSPFPIDTGKRAADFLSWLGRLEKDLIEDGVNLTSDLQCGETFQLFALVSLGELFMSPCLPNEGVGEADEPKLSKTFFPMEQVGDVDVPNILKRKSDKVNLSSSERPKKHKPQGKIDADFCSRREKGFPGIRVVLNRATIPRADTVQCLTDTKNTSSILSCDDDKRGNSCSAVENIGGPSLSSNSDSCQNLGCNTQSAISLNDLPWDCMTTYAVRLSSVPDVGTEAIVFSRELFQIVHSAIHQAGEQGLGMKEISQAMGLQGLQWAELVVETLEAFRLAMRVNAYDNVRVVDSAYRSKYFISTATDCNQCHDMASYMKSQVSFRASQQLHQEKHISNCNSRETSIKLCDGHKVTVLDLPKEPAPPHSEGQSIEGTVMLDTSKQVAAVPIQEKEVGDIGRQATFVAQVSRPIVPWINGDGSTNIIVYKGLTRRVLGTVMQNPGILEEDIIRRMDVLNPQSCRLLLELMVLDNHLTVRMMHQNTLASPAILQTLLNSKLSKPESVFRKHFFANPMSACLL